MKQYTKKTVLALNEEIKRMKSFLIKLIGMTNIVLMLLILSVLSGCKQKGVTNSHTTSTVTLIPAMPPAELPPTPILTIPTMPSAEEAQPVPVTPPTVIPKPITKKELVQEKALSTALVKKAEEKKRVTYDSGNPNELDFDVENRTGKTVYITCFDYQRKRNFGNWRWDKSPVYKLEPGQTVTVDIDTIPDEQDRERVYGYLGVFNDQTSADDATYELTEDHLLLDLDRLVNLKGKKVTLEIEKYGSKGEFFEYDFVNKDGEEPSEEELDFIVENRTGKPILVTCFVYEKKAKGSWSQAVDEKDDMAVWRYDKTPLIKIMPNELGMVDVDTIMSGRDREYVRGYLAVFDIDEEKFARESTYELLPTRYKLPLGELPRLKNRKIVIGIEKYGAAEDFIDFVIKPARKIDFTKIKPH